MRIQARGWWRRGGLVGVIAPLLLLVAAVAEAEIYKWTDQSGQTHYSQKPPTGPEGAHAEKMEVKTKVTEGGASAPSGAEEDLRQCGSLMLPADRPDPVTNIAMFREAIAIWQKYIDENQGKSDEATLQAIKARRCAIAYANRKLEALSEVEQDIEANYRRVSDELEELRELVAECDELSAEDGEQTAAACRQQHQPRIKELETMQKRLEGPAKAVRTKE